MHKNGFTLIELLLVVAIMAILAAIAIPNFLEAQMRAKVSKVKADFRTIKTGLELYRVSEGDYPLMEKRICPGQNNRGDIHKVITLTTPTSYMSSVDLPDPFVPPFPRNSMGDLDVPRSEFPGGETPYSLGYVNIIAMFRQERRPPKPPHHVPYMLLSLGPDLVRGPSPNGGRWIYGSYGENPPKNNYYAAWTYDASNGTRSGGDLLMWP